MKNDQYKRFNMYMMSMLNVHGDHSITAILFSISSLFQKEITAQLSFFPIYFLQGPFAVGKSELANCCLSIAKCHDLVPIYHDQLTSKRLKEKVTDKSSVIIEIADYQKTNKDFDVILNGLWDRRGYRVASLDNEMEIRKIISSVIITGNCFPENDSLKTRMVLSFMNKYHYNEMDQMLFKHLRVLTNQGWGELPTKNFEFTTEKFLYYFKSKTGFLLRTPSSTPLRVIKNYAVMYAVYKVFESILVFPFSEHQMLSYFETSIEKQLLVIDNS